MDATLQLEIELLRIALQITEAILQSDFSARIAQTAIVACIAGTTAIYVMHKTHKLTVKRDSKALDIVSLDTLNEHLDNIGDTGKMAHERFNCYSKGVGIAKAHNLNDLYKKLYTLYGITSAINADNYPDLMKKADDLSCHSSLYSDIRRSIQQRKMVLVQE